MNRYRLLLIIILSSVLSVYALTPQVFYTDSALTVNGADPISGIWLTQPGSALISIEPTSPQGVYNLYVLDSPDYTIVPGTLVAHLSATADSQKYDAEFILPSTGLTGDTGGNRTMSAVITLTEEGRFTITHYRRENRLSLRRLLPFLFRSILRDSDRPGALDGAVRINPQSPSLIISL